VYWEIAPDKERVFDVSLGESRQDFEARIKRFRHDLWIRLAALAVGLLLAQALVLRLGLAPLERLARELRLIEYGERETLSEDQPRELRTVAANMNHLIRFGQRTLTRHRNALADLAHALKTPLAVLRGAAEDAPAEHSPLRDTVLDGVSRMDEALSYRLRKASSMAGNSLGPPVPVEPLVLRLVATFEKVYAAKALRVSVDVEADLAARTDSGDLTEILGNLLDNACKWARQVVRLQIRPTQGRDGIDIVVEDDGPGIDPGQREQILERGVRADEQVPGQGLGLSLVREIAEENYGGRIAVEQSPEGGARVCVTLFSTVG
jgi:two-component system sensor histidine kinase PhoQ